MEFASLVIGNRVARHDSAAIDDQPEIDMNQGNYRGNYRGNYGGGGSDDRASGGYGSDGDDDRNTDDQRDQRDQRGSVQRAGWQDQGGNHWPQQRQQQADSGGWLSHQQQGNQQQGGGSDWQGRASQQHGGGNDWQGSGQQGADRSSSPESSVRTGSGYSGYQGQAERYGNEQNERSRGERERYGDDESSSTLYGQRSGYGGDPRRMEAHRYGGNRAGEGWNPGGGRDLGGPSGYGEGRYGEYGEGQQRGSRERFVGAGERERWGDWHQEGRAGRASEWSNQQPNRRMQEQSPRMQERSRQMSGQWPDTSRSGGAPWDEPSRSPDMRTHYPGAYGVSDYEPSGGQQGTRNWGGPAAGSRGYGGYGGASRSAGVDRAGYDRDDRAYEQFTGANERSSLNRGYGGAGGSAVARAQRVAPKGYQRSDERIREDLCERLTHNGRLNVRDVEVTVSGGVVTLSGSVMDRQQKYRIEDIADDVFGVKDVQNQLRVRREGAAQSGSQSDRQSDSQSGTQSGSRLSGMSSSGSATGSSASSYTGGLEAGKSGKAPAAIEQHLDSTTPGKSST
ncbi:BON domain-containing protein [Cupriavidus sp. SIMBA_020]|uniref:BON domain-containing protein n=1 Tax=Cupriavidus sp. SIMBA_020 TaxID=3085766 RepID=UPI003979AA0B